MRAVSAREARAGFTLLETVVALTLLAAIAGFLAIAFRMASASIARGEDAARESARIRAGIAILERAVRSADAMPFAQGDRAAPYFRGERERVRLLSASPPSAVAGAGPRLLSFSGSVQGLMMAAASPFRAGGPQDWEGTEGARPVVPEARAVVFSYSAGPDEEGAWEWVEEWDAAEAGRLPAAVRVELTTQAESGMPLSTSFVVPVLGGR